MKTSFLSNRTKEFSLFSRCIFALSLICMTILFSIGGRAIYIWISAFISAGISIFFCIFKKAPNILLNRLNPKAFILSTIATLSAGFQYFYAFKDAYGFKISSFFANLSLNEQTSTKITINLLVLISSIAIFSLFYIFFSQLFFVAKQIYEKFDKIDKCYFIIFVLVFSFLVIIAYSLTYVFYAPQIKEFIYYDVLFTSDSGALYDTNCWINVGAPENDLRQPLFGVFSAPFAVIAFGLSRFLFFIPNAYAYLISIVQIVILSISFILISKMLGIKGVSKAFALAFMSLTFSTLIFVINLEQYVFATFWLILSVYIIIEKIPSTDNVFIASTGSLVTNGVLLCTLIKKSDFKKSLLQILKIGIYFVLICFIFGRGAYLLGIIDQIKNLLAFAGGKVSFIDRIGQYTIFLCDSFVAPEFFVEGNFLRISPSTDINIIGLVVMCVCVISFILNMKNNIAKASGFWFLFSFILLIILGWGSSENGMLLYSLYFDWSIYSLIILMIEKIPAKLNIAKYSIYLLILMTLVVFNVRGLVELIEFGQQYYPGVLKL